MAEEKKTYTVMDSKRGKTFATLDEANAYEREHRKRTGEFVAVVAGTKAVTHTYGVQATAPATTARKTTPKKPTAKKATKGKPAKSKPAKQTPKNKAKKTGTRKTTAKKK